MSDIVAIRRDSWACRLTSLALVVSGTMLVGVATLNFQSPSCAQELYKRCGRIQSQLVWVHSEAGQSYDFEMRVGDTISYRGTLPEHPCHDLWGEWQVGRRLTENQSSVRRILQNDDKTHSSRIDCDEECE